MEVFSEVPGLMAFLVEPFVLTDDAWSRLERSAEAPAVLARAHDLLGNLETHDAASIEAALRSMCSELELKPGKAFAPVRWAVTGRTVSPGLFESIEALGRDRTRERLAHTRERLAAVPAG